MQVVLPLPSLFFLLGPKNIFLCSDGGILTEQVVLRDTKRGFLDPNMSVVTGHLTSRCALSVPNIDEDISRQTTVPEERARKDHVST